MTHSDTERCHGYQNCCSCGSCNSRAIEKLAAAVRRPDQTTNDGRDRRKIRTLLDRGFVYVGDDEDGMPILEAPLDVLLGVVDV